MPFGFKNETGARTTHHLILVTKHFKGYEVMKDVMAKSSSTVTEGVPSFTYSPAADESQNLLFELNRPLLDLRDMLLRDFAGKTHTMRQIYELHSVDKPFLSRNYKQVLTELESEGLIQTKGRKNNRGFADYIQVTFPTRKSL